MAEYITNNLAGVLGKNIVANSAGIKADGSPINEKSVKALKDIGIDGSEHISQAITQEIIDGADHVITLTQEHKSTIIELFSIDEVKISTINGFLDKIGDVLDPRDCEFKVYEATRNELHGLVKNVLSKL